MLLNILVFVAVYGLLAYVALYTIRAVWRWINRS